MQGRNKTGIEACKNILDDSGSEKEKRQSLFVVVLALENRGDWAGSHYVT